MTASEAETAGVTPAGAGTTFQSQGTRSVSPVGSTAAEASDRWAAGSDEYGAARDEARAIRVLRNKNWNAAHVRGWRYELELTQQEVAERAGTLHSYVSKLESGDHIPTIPVLQRILRVLDEELLIGIERQVPDEEPDIPVIAAVRYITRSTRPRRRGEAAHVLTRDLADRHRAEVVDDVLTGAETEAALGKLRERVAIERSVEREAEASGRRGAAADARPGRRGADRREARGRPQALDDRGGPAVRRRHDRGVPTGRSSWATAAKT